MRTQREIALRKRAASRAECEQLHCAIGCAVLARTVLDDGASPAALDRVTGALAIRCRAHEGAFPRAVELARAAIAQGIPHVALWCDRPPAPRELSEASAARVGELGIALHGARREVHDWHAGEGSFDGTLRALSVARAHGLACAVATAVTRSNARVLVELPSFLKANGVVAWTLVWPRADERSATFTSIVPRIGLGAPSALAALDRARRLGLDACIAGLPTCALGPFAALSVRTPARSYGDRCATCAARDACAGVDAAYLARFGDGELHAIERSIDGDARARAWVAACYAPCDRDLAPRRATGDG